MNEIQSLLSIKRIEVLQASTLYGSRLVDSIAFPLISSGIFGGNLHHPSRISYTYARRAYDDFVKAYPAYSVEMRICAFSESEYNEIVQGE